MKRISKVLVFLLMAVTFSLLCMPAEVNSTPLVRYLTNGVQFTDGYRDLCRRASPSVHKIFILFLLPFCNFFYIIPYGDIIRRSPTGFAVSNAAGRVSGNEGYDMIRLKDVEKTYENGTEALQGISFTIEDGEFVFLVGPSGSGKSTIIKLLTGEVIPTAGRVMVNGFSMSRISDRQIPYMRRTIGVIFQDFRLIPKKTVFDNLSLAMRAVGATPRDIRTRIPYVLELVGLKGMEDRYPDELSGGEQQRVAIARALVNNPSTIVADEPTGNLDPNRSLEIMTLLERINALGTTVVVVTHERDLVNHFDKRVIMIDHGQVNGDGVGTYEV